MSKAYLIDQSNQAKLLARIRCSDEERELQDLLERNPNLLPSEQIDPENPPEWLLVQREMPVTNPGTGSERWSIDFFFVDHAAVPTLVECKRCADTRSRREVIAQMLEYAANGHYYWTAEDLRARAQDAAGGAEQLAAWVGRYYAAGGGVEAFFEAVAVNLRKATMRLVFFLEESPYELRSLVEFLNGQLKETEVLIVEARLYDLPEGRFVVPWLFGYSEQARVAKRESRSQVARQAGSRGEAAYMVAIEQGDVSEQVRAAIKAVIANWPTGDASLPHWWFGANAILVVPSMLPNRGIFQIGRNGDLQLYFGYWNPVAYADVGSAQIAFRTQFSDKLRELFGVTFSEKQLRGFPTIKAAQWVPKADQFVQLVKSLSCSAAAMEV